MSNRQRMQSDNPLFGQVNPEMASPRGNGGEPVSPAAVAASSTSSSTAHASAAAADPPFVVTRAMKDEALEMAKDAAAEDGDDWNKFDKKKQRRRLDTQLKLVVAEARAEAAKAGESAAKAGESAAKAGESAAKADLAARDAAEFQGGGAWALLYQQLPRVRGGHISHSNTKDGGIPPTSVHELSHRNFWNLAQVMNVVGHLSRVKATKYPFYLNEDERLSVQVVDQELGVVRAFGSAFARIEHFFEWNGLREHFPFELRDKAPDGQADNSIREIGIEQTCVVTGEYKPMTYNSKGESMAVVWASEQKLDKSPIRQTYMYSRGNGVFFGILSSYVWVWFFIRDCHGNLVIVAGFHMDDESVVQAIVAFVKMAGENKLPQELITQEYLFACPDKCSHWFPAKTTTKDSGAGGSSSGSGGNSSGSGGQDKANPGGGGGGGSRQQKDNRRNKTTRRGRDGGGGGGNSKVKQTTSNKTVITQDPDDVSTYLYNVETNVYGDMQREYLPSGRTGTTIRYRTLCGLDVVSKKADLVKQPEIKAELLIEAKAYDKMSHLQGDVIPELKGYGLDPRNTWMYTLTTSHAGIPVSTAEGGLYAEEKLTAVKALEAVHAAGVLHGDIKAENILVLREAKSMPGKVRLVDFAFAKVDCSDVVMFERKASQEHEQLARVLQKLPTVVAAESIDTSLEPLVANASR